MVNYTLSVLSQDGGLQVSSARPSGPSGPTATLLFCVNQGTAEGLAGVYRLGITTGSYSRVYSARLVQSVAGVGDGVYLSAGDEPYGILLGDYGLTAAPSAVYTASSMVWDIAADWAAGGLRFTEDHLVRSIPLGGGDALTLATFSYWMREIAVDPATGDVWAHAQDPADIHMLVRLDQSSSWSASVAFATSSYIGGLAWHPAESAPVFTCGLNSAGVYSLSGASATPLLVDQPWAQTYSAWKSLGVGDSGDIFLGSLRFGTGESAGYLARLVPA